MSDPIVKTIVVGCTPARAFDVFVRRIADWWPLDTHAVSAAAGQAARDVTIEPVVGGAVYETTHDGSRSDWGAVLEFDEGVRFAMTWHPGTNTAFPTRVEVVFAALGDDRCEVTLTHSGWEVWGAEAGPKRDNYAEGWSVILDDRYLPACEAEAPAAT